jgi:hypothetical protein
MYCPNCGQQQLSDEMRFCSRCGLALSGLAEWLAGGTLPPMITPEATVSPSSPRRRGMRRAAKLMFLSGVLFPVFLFICFVIKEGAPMIIPIVLFFVSVVLMLYARLFGDPNPHVNLARAQAPRFDSTSARGSLPPPISIPITDLSRQTRTNELAQPPSVTEKTTRLLDNE